MANANRVDGAKRGHVKRQLKEDGFLSDKVLAYILEIINESRNGASNEQFLDSIAYKLTNKQELTDYEKSFLFDALLTP